MVVKKEKFDVMKTLKQNASRNNSLFQVQIDLTYECNAKCFFCFQGNIHANSITGLTHDQICILLNDLRKLGCFYIGFSGGEPFCREDILSIIRYAKRLGFMISIVTNLQLPSTETILEFSKIGVNRITVSFHAIEKKVYCDIFNVSDIEYNRALSNIDTLISQKSSLSIAATISILNYTEMVKIKRYFMNLGLSNKDINFNMLVQGKNDIQGYRDSDEFYEYIEANRDLKSNMIEKNDGFMCTAGRITCTIGPYGDVFPCAFLNASAGNVKDSTLEDIWNDSHLFKFLRSLDENYFEKCVSCSNNYYCHICMANNMNETGLFHTPAESYCKFRKKITRNLG